MHDFLIFPGEVYGHTKVASYHRKALGLGDFSFNVINEAADANPKKSNMINCWEEDVKIELGTANEIGGKYALLSLERATEDLIKGNIDALVTAPINKHNIQSETFAFPGHTEYLQLIMFDFLGLASAASLITLKLKSPKPNAFLW